MRESQGKRADLGAHQDAALSTIALGQGSTDAALLGEHDETARHLLLLVADQDRALVAEAHQVIEVARRTLVIVSLPPCGHLR